MKNDMYEFEMLPKPNVPNVNGIVFTKESLDKALVEYQKTINNGRAYVLDKYPSMDENLYEIPIDRHIVGFIKGVQFDESKNSYIATAQMLPETTVYEMLRLNYGFTMSANKIGNVVDCIATEPISIVSMTIAPKK